MIYVDEDEINQFNKWFDSFSWWCYCENSTDYYCDRCRAVSKKATKKCPNCNRPMREYIDGERNEKERLF